MGEGNGREAREERLVWIFGSSRSGSSWLLSMLSGLDGVAAIDDPHLGHHLGVWRPIPLAWWAAEEQQELRTLREIKRGNPSYFFSDRYSHVWGPALRRMILERFGFEARDAVGGEPRVIVIKEPGSHVADLLLTLFPRSRMIFLLRDGRDVVDSWLAAYRQGSWALGEGAFPVAPWGRLPLVRWQATVWLYRTEVVQRAYARQRPSRRVLVRYEHLLADPARALARICRRLALAADPGRLREIADANTYESIPEGEKGELSFVRAVRPGRWRESLSPMEQRAMQEIIGPKLAELAYPVERRYVESRGSVADVG